MLILNLLPLMITAAGLFFLIKLKFFFIAHPIRTAKMMKIAVGRKESRKAVCLALAGTLGVGNIVGVAYGISVGGAGAVFWIFASGVFSSVIKYAESTLAADKRNGKFGGMSYVLSNSFGRLGKLFGIAYSLFCLALSLTMGSALQSRSAIFAISEFASVPEYLIAFIFSVLVFAVVVGGSQKIEKAVSRIIPVSTIIYIALCLAVIVINLSSLPSVLLRILREAFSFTAFGGGVSSFVAIRAMREGYARGLLSNEAGTGTSSMAQCKSSLSPSFVGLLGILEVFFDTVLLCTLTGVAVLISGADAFVGSGISIIIRSVSVIPFGELVVGVLIFAFAYSTVVCWYYYGCECIRYIFGDVRSASYTALFVFSVFIGFVISESVLISATDILLFFMSLLTLFALIKNSERIVVLSENYGLLKKSDVREKRESRILD